MKVKIFGFFVLILSVLILFLWLGEEEKATNYWPSEKIERTYHRGYKTLLKIIKSKDIDFSFFEKLLPSLDSIGWGLWSPTGMEIKSGDENKVANIFILSHDHPQVNYKTPPLITGTYLKKPGIKIAPYPISELWAGIFLMHELIHVQDELLAPTAGVKYGSPQFWDAELRAYFAEYYLTNLLSDGRFAKKIDLLIKEQEIKDYKSAYLKMTKGSISDDNLNKLSRTIQIENSIIQTQPLSRTEIDLRKFFFAISVGLRLAKNSSKGNWGETSLLAIQEIHKFNE